MIAISVFLADEQTDAVLAAWRLTDPATVERVMIFGAIGGVTLLALLWAAFLRKKRKRRHGHHHSSHHSAEPAQASPAPPPTEIAPGAESPRRHRRSRRRQRPRNPTLAETGGLPPIRREDPPELSP